MVEPPGCSSPHSNRNFFSAPMDENDFLNNVLSLHKENNWKEILKLNEDSKNEVARNLLWVWPSEENLNFMKTIITANHKNGVTSLGCGNGLFEWILNQYTNLPVIGFEVNEDWWKSKYSSPQFITLEFPTFPLGKSSLNNEHALLFCYFNNGPAFINYIDTYMGNLVFIVGPGKGRGTHTNPEPFKPNFGNTKWKLIDFQEIKTSKDFIAAYVRDF